MLLFDMHADFFSDVVLQRNLIIKEVVLVEASSILPLPGRLEASGVESVWGEVSQESPKNPEKSGKSGKIVLARGV